MVHVGAGLSTAAGIPDFRGKRGVWTRKLQRDSRERQQQQQQTTLITDHPDATPRNEDAVKLSDTKVDSKPKKETEEEEFKPFDETEPTYAHMALGELCRNGFVGHIISQNVDGLFLKSNLNRKFISELHGNFYLDECTRCRSRFIRSTASTSMRLQKSTTRCPQSRETRQCKGYLRDTILDWESPIPYNELRIAEREAKRSKLHICIGTSMQLKPSKDFVCDPQRSKQARLVVINLQPTQMDSRANLVIHYYADGVMKQLSEQLDLDIPDYSSKLDPTKQPESIGRMWKRNDA